MSCCTTGEAGLNLREMPQNSPTNCRLSFLGHFKRVIPLRSIHLFGKSWSFCNHIFLLIINGTLSSNFISLFSKNVMNNEKWFAPMQRKYLLIICASCSWTIAVFKETISWLYLRREHDQQNKEEASHMKI